jgi:hypothetical protein
VFLIPFPHKNRVNPVKVKEYERLGKSAWQIGKNQQAY